MSVVDWDDGTTFQRARRRSAYRRLAQAVGRGAPAELLPLSEAELRLRPFSRHYVGVRSIPLRQIVGTEGRVGDFDRDFLPRRPDIAARWRSVEKAFPDGNFPPIVVNQLGDAYFVIDGHHRVAIARQQGMETIDAAVTELRATWHLRADSDAVELIHAEQHRIFMEESGLASVKPDACFGVSRLSGYSELLENVQIHGYYLMLCAGRPLTRHEIAADWYELVYLPAFETFRREGLEPLRTEADLFLCVYERRRELQPDGGRPPIEEAVRQVLEGDAKRTRPRLRRLLAPRAAENAR